MTFYKTHSAKYTSSRVLFVPEKFDEIGPDAFCQTKFEIIILSRRVKSVQKYAFSGLKKCKVYLPNTISDIDPLAFEDMDEGNIFYCRPGSEAYEMCIKNQLKVNESIEELLEYAESVKTTAGDVNIYNGTKHLVSEYMGDSKQSHLTPETYNKFGVNENESEIAS